MVLSCVSVRSSKCSCASDEMGSHDRLPAQTPLEGKLAQGEIRTRHTSEIQLCVLDSVWRVERERDCRMAGAYSCLM